MSETKKILLELFIFILEYFFLLEQIIFESHIRWIKESFEVLFHSFIKFIEIHIHLFSFILLEFHLFFIFPQKEEFMGGPLIGKSKISTKGLSFDIMFHFECFCKFFSPGFQMEQIDIFLKNTHRWTSAHG